MRYLTAYPLIVAFLLFSNFANAQFNVAITVNDGSSTTTCTDNFGGPHPMWSVNIENQGWVTYPSNVICYNDFPNQQFQQTYQCLTDIPATMQVCFRAFENDASIFSPCTEVTSCLEETCIDVPVPPFGSADFTLELPDGLSSDGEANLTITSVGIPGGVNDLPCQAIDVGILQNGTTVGIADSSIFNNFCSTNIGEPNPFAFNGGIVNHRGVWFKFTSNANPGTHVLIEAMSDPSNFGDPIDLEIAVFTSSGDCNGPFNLISSIWDATDFNESLIVDCIQPNTDYYIMIDGKALGPGNVDGYFGLQITEMEVQLVGDLICDAMDLGPVPLGGSVANTGLISNGCSTGIGEPCVGGLFCIQAGVWLTFEAPPTGHVQIDVISNDALDAIDIQFAVFQTSDGTCNGTLSEQGFVYTSFDNDEHLELSCLNAGETYYMLVDGAFFNTTDLIGIFDITVSDAGDETPTLNQDITLCAGETLMVGTEIYDQTGNYMDTLSLPSGCDSIVNTNLVVLDELALNFEFTNIGLNLGNTAGTATVNPSGGAGGYDIIWSNGQTTNTAISLVGGDNYCVEVTDDNNCIVDSCFVMPFYENFITQVLFDTLDCFGDMDATIEFTAELGEPPYTYAWQNSTSTSSGSGQILFDGQMVIIDNLSADIYTINISDVNYDTVLQIEIVQPDIISIGNSLLGDASCFSTCDGTIDLTVNGGVAPYQLAWSNGSAGPQLTGLCAGGFETTVTDANGCAAIFDYQINQPTEFIATAELVQNVSCFQGDDGAATVSTNGNPDTYLWSNGEMTESITTLIGGIYEVTVTNMDGCTATSSIEVMTPSAPVSVNIIEVEPVLCFGENTGILDGTASGPGANFTYEWSNGNTDAIVNDLAAGTYSVTVSNEFGCTAMASYILTQPDEITLDFTTNSLTCNDPINGGIITIENISGGIDPYLYSSNGAVYGTEPEIMGFTAGQNVFYVQDAIGCIREFEAIIDGPEEINLILGDDITIDLGDYVDLSAQSNILDLTYEWSPAEGMSCPDCDETEVQPFQSTTYSLTVTDEYDCTATADIFVTVVKKRKVFVPNAFSPNGDGINDMFTPFVGPDVVLIEDFQVFDRQGNQVFEADSFLPGDLSNAWDGMFRGKIMNPGVFVWFANVQFLDGETEVFEGDVTLVR